jgi:hypothetical protein
MEAHGLTPQPPSPPEGERPWWDEFITEIPEGEPTPLREDREAPGEEDEGPAAA